MSCFLYGHFTKDTGALFYVGKGTMNRVYSSGGRSNFWHKTVNKHGFTWRILTECETEEEAFALEKELIALFGRRDNGTGTLVNLTDGGEGSNPSEETRAKQSAAKKGKPLSEEHRANMAKAQRGRKHSEETRRKIGDAHRGMRKPRRTVV